MSKLLFRIEEQGAEGACVDRKGILFVVSAPSGAGKTSLCRAVSQRLDHLQYSISYTTRPSRVGEVDGRDYFFIDEASFKKRIEQGDFIEWAQVHGHFYGTSQNLLAEWTASGTDVILDIDSQGAMLLKQRSAEGVYIYVLPPSFDILKKRLTARGSESPEEMSRRLIKAKDEIRYYKEYQYLIINKAVEEAIDNLESVILAERIRMRQDDYQWIENRFISCKR